jgi:hypothetical protein
MKVKLKIKIKSKFYTYETNTVVNQTESLSEHKSFEYLLRNNIALRPVFSN